MVVSTRAGGEKEHDYEMGGRRISLWAKRPLLTSTDGYMKCRDDRTWRTQTDGELCGSSAPGQKLCNKKVSAFV